jgi:hypothetical protein
LGNGSFNHGLKVIANTVFQVTYSDTKHNSTKQLASKR